MLYAVLCYNDENAVSTWTKEEDDAVMARLQAVTGAMEAKGKLGPVARLKNTTQARTLRKSGERPLVVDGPFAETKEQFLGFYVVDCESMEEVEVFVRELAEANPGSGSYEIRPVGFFAPSALPAKAGDRSAA
jgi:Uncharacterized protein conserved in bacteria